MFKFLIRPLLNSQTTGNYSLERPYKPPLDNVYGVGGIMISRELLKLRPMQIVPNRTAIPVSIGGSSNLSYEGVNLQSLSEAPPVGSQL